MSPTVNSLTMVEQQLHSLAIEDESETVVDIATQNKKKKKKKKITERRTLLLLNCIFLAIGSIGGPLLTRLYFIHGGERKWLACLLESTGFPILLLPLLLLFIKAKAQGVPSSTFFIQSKLFLSSALIGLLFGLNNFMYALGLSYIPVSTSSILLASQLAFVAVFTWLIVKQRFTPYSVNSVLLMTIGSVLLGLRGNGDRPAGVSNHQYYLGFFLTLASALLLGLLLPSIELAYSKASQTISFTTVLQFQINLGLFATLFSLTGMIINKDFQAIPREAMAYELGKGKYYLVLVMSAIVWQLAFLGLLGVVFYTSSLFSGIYFALLLPLTEIAAVIAFKEKFNGEKGIALALCLWGFTSYFYGEYRKNKKKKKLQSQTLSHTRSDDLQTSTV